MAKEAAQKIRVFVVDPLPVRRAGTINVLRRAFPGAEINSVGEIEAVDAASLTDLKLIVLAIGGDAFGASPVRARIAGLVSAFGSVPIVILSDREDREDLLAARDAGVRGFIPTTLELAVAMLAFKLILGGGVYFPPSAFGASDRGPRPLPQCAAPSAAVVTDRFTPRQVQVLLRLSQGKSNKLIGRELAMRESTVKVHVRQILRKLGVANRTQAAVCGGGVLQGERLADVMNAASGHAVTGDGPPISIDALITQ